MSEGRVRAAVPPGRWSGLARSLARRGLLDLQAVAGDVVRDLNDRQRASQLLFRLVVLPGFVERDSIVVTKVFLAACERPEPAEGVDGAVEVRGAVEADGRGGDGIARGVRRAGHA